MPASDLSGTGEGASGTASVAVVGPLYNGRPDKSSWDATDFTPAV